MKGIYLAISAGIARCAAGMFEHVLRWGLVKVPALTKPSSHAGGGVKENLSRHPK